MADFDAFNGDADGICSLVQLRLAEPRNAQLVTGVKRDINLLKRVEAGSGDRVTALDIAMEKNIAALKAMLEAGASVTYVDHHHPGEIPSHPKLDAHINTAPEVCTSLLVNGLLKGRFAAWAVTGAFGDNLERSAHAAASAAGLAADSLPILQKLGTYLNYNGYGPSLADLHFRPDALYQALSPFNDPLDFVRSDGGEFRRLEDGYLSDMAAVASIKPLRDLAHAAVYLLPDEPWARRVSGVFSNELVNRYPDRAHAVVTESADSTLLISVRAPLNRRVGADEVCRQFVTGGGRKAAAGINALPAAELEHFIGVFTEFYRCN